MADRACKTQVKVTATSLNPVDARGVIGDKLPSYFDGFNRYLIDSCVVGFDFAGTVAAKGSDVTNFNIHDEVFGTVPAFRGSFKQFLVAEASETALKPSNLSPTQAAALPLAALTAYQVMYHDYPQPPHSNILIVGASGGVGHLATQIAARCVRGCVTAVCSKKNIGIVQSFGAQHIVDYTLGSEHIKQQLADIVQRNGKFRLCFDTVSSINESDSRAFDYEDYLTHSQLIEGMYVKLGGHTTEWITAGLKRTIGWNLFGGQKELFWVRFPRSHDDLDTIRRMCEESKIVPLIAREVQMGNIGG